MKQNNCSSFLVVLFCYLAVEAAAATATPDVFFQDLSSLLYNLSKVETFTIRGESVLFDHNEFIIFDGLY